MRLFLIEDNTDFIEPFSDYALENGVDLEVACDLGAALKRINAGPGGVDLVVCDLKIPSDVGGIDAEVEHGLTALKRLLGAWAGVPVIVVSAFGTLEVMADLLLQARQQDIYGSGDQVAMLRFAQKANLATAMEMITAGKMELEELDAIELLNVDDLTDEHQRALKIFARRRGGLQVRYRPLSGGRSGARTGLASIHDSSGAPVANVVAKMTRLESALEERERYQTYISGRLGAGTYANVSGEVLAGCHGDAGIFYSVADIYSRDLFTVVGADPVLAAETVIQLASFTNVWTVAAPQRTMEWRVIRSVLLSDEKHEHVLTTFDVQVVPDDKRIQSVWAPQHGDLHPANVLVDESGRPVLIDYGRTDLGASVLDPLTLELSVIFHPDSPFRDHDWPSSSQLASWDNLDEYLVDCPYPDYIIACRNWTKQVCAGNWDLFATVNAYCLRNLYFGEVDPSRALILQNLAARRLA